jgi:hypothetical protein
MRKQFLVLAALWVGLGQATAAQAEVLNIIQTTITSAQTDLDVDRSYSWAFGVSGPLTFDSMVGVFTLKTGANTTAPAVLKLFEANGSFQPTTEIASFSYPAASASQSFTALTFTLSGTSVTLNGNYYLLLESPASSTGNFQWFIKDPTQSVVFENDSGQAISGFSGGSPVPVPEPASFVSCLVVLAGGSALGLPLRRMAVSPRGSMGGSEGCAA